MCKNIRTERTNKRKTQSTHTYGVIVNNKGNKVTRRRGRKQHE